MWKQDVLISQQNFCNVGIMASDVNWSFGTGKEDGNLFSEVLELASVKLLTHQPLWQKSLSSSHTHTHTHPKYLCVLQHQNI